MANKYSMPIIIAFMLFSVHKSIIKFHVSGEIQPGHHIRHSNHQYQHPLQHHRSLSQRHRGTLNRHDDLHNKLGLNITNDSKQDHPPILEQIASGNSPKDVHNKTIKSPSAHVDHTSIKCPKCSGNTNVRVSEDELTKLRIEYVKNQILEKLRLDEQPKITKRDLPRPVYEGATIRGDVQSQSKDYDDYYARTSQKFIFLEQERTECDRVSHSPAICFQFKIDSDFEASDVSTAELWIYKNSNKNDLNYNQSFVVSELHLSDNNDTLPNVEPIAIQPIGTEAGWIKIDIAWATKQWFNNRFPSHIIQISCPSCKMNINEGSLLSTANDFRPFILIDATNRRKHHRQKRYVDCSEGVTECCREKLFISFAEMGWDNWILQPRGYDAYFCRGTCSTLASVALTTSYYGSVLKKLIFARQGRGERTLELIPCCSARKFSSLQLLYLDSNKTAILKTLPNMVVEVCGCS
ncbi:growth/differentiation factor 8 [Hermetia illucens]|nr:growth/differentiation factor 8 [Hermetia illucens]